MALALNTDWAKLRYFTLLIVLVSVLLAAKLAHGSVASKKQKRQLFREQLLPEYGGKIPGAALTADRLLLNKFNQNGLFTIDGWHLEQRHPNDVHLPKKYLPNTIKINLPPDNTNVAPPGRYYSHRPVDTTYLVRDPVNYAFFPRNLHQSSFPLIPHDSLQLFRKFKFEKMNNLYVSEWNEVFPTAHKILRNLAPYIHKLDYYG